MCVTDRGSSEEAIVGVKPVADDDAVTYLRIKLPKSGDTILISRLLGFAILPKNRAKIIVSPELWCKLNGTRFDCGDKAGFQMANLAFALEHPEIKDTHRKNWGHNTNSGVFGLGVFP